MSAVAGAGAALATLWVTVAALSVGPAGAAQGDAGAIQPGHRTFAADYVAAVDQPMTRPPITRRASPVM